MPVRSGPVRRSSSSRASCGRLSASALGPWSPWLSSSKMLSACTSPRRTIATAFSFEMCRALNTASTGKSTASSGANSSSALGPGKTVVSASAPKVRNACQLSPSSDSTRRHFGQRPSRGMTRDARLEQPQHVVLERDEAPLAVVVEDDRLRLEVVVHLGLAESAAQAAADQPLQRRGGRALAAEVVGEALVGVALLGEHVGELASRSGRAGPRARRRA